jgi:hypothetical protein
MTKRKKSAMGKRKSCARQVIDSVVGGGSRLRENGKENVDRGGGSESIVDQIQGFPTPETLDQIYREIPTPETLDQIYREIPTPETSGLWAAGEKCEIFTCS